VLDDYERNCTLIDLNAQPADVKATVDACIREQLSHKDVGMVGAHFLKFCGKYELTKLSDSADQVSRWLNETYKGVLNDISQTSSRKSVLDTQENNQKIGQLEVAENGNCHHKNSRQCCELQNCQDGSRGCEH
jgi:hypothetical protein